MVHLHVKNAQTSKRTWNQASEGLLPARRVPCCSPLEPRRREGRERPLNLSRAGWASAEVHDRGQFSSHPSAPNCRCGKYMGHLAIWVFPTSCRRGELCQRHCWCNGERKCPDGWLATEVYVGGAKKYNSGGTAGYVLVLRKSSERTL